MKTHLKAALASVMILLAGAAAAADFRSARSLPQAPALPTVYDWTGVYVGGQIGYSWGSDSTRELLTAGPTPLGGKFDYHPESVIGGGHAGFNYQMGSIVVGVEGDVEGMHARGGFQYPSRVRSPNDPGSLVRVSQDWQASARARIGFAFDRFMIYGTGGAAFTEFTYSHFNPLAGVGERGSASRTGWTAGGGVNYAITDTLILGAGYRYIDYGRFNHVASSPLLGVTAAQNPSMHTVRASVAYKF